MDIRLEFAEEVAEEIQAVLVEGRCDKCGWPLMEKPEQGMPFCWGCTTDKRTAMEGREKLLRAKLAERGIEMPAGAAWRAAEPEKTSEELNGCFQSGQPL